MSEEPEISSLTPLPEEEEEETGLTVYLSTNELPVHKLTRAEFLADISTTLDDYSTMSFTPEEKRQIANHLKKVAHGASVMVPLLCVGPDCPFADQCPLQQMSRAPIGMRCPIETQLFQYWRLRYME